MFRLVYIKCRDDDGRFQSPPGMDNSVSAALRRLAVVGRVLQCAMAETLWSQRRGRVTFRSARGGGGGEGGGHCSNAQMLSARNVRI